MLSASNRSAAIIMHAAKLKDEGYCVIPDALPAAVLDSLDADLATRFVHTPFGEGGFYGTETKRFGRLLARSPHAATLVAHSLILGIVEEILLPWCDCIQLNTTQAISIYPGAPAQIPHRDHDMWQCDKGDADYLINVIWPLTEFTSDNGATRVWPRNHGLHAHDPAPNELGIAIEMTPGSALLVLGSSLHGAGANRTNAPRRGVVIGYSLGWLKPYENQWLAYPPDIARHFPPELAALVGYRQHRPNLGNYEGQCPSVLFEGDRERPLGAIDALRPDQQLAVEQHRESQRATP